MHSPDAIQMLYDACPLGPSFACELKAALQTLERPKPITSKELAQPSSHSKKPSIAPKALIIDLVCLNPTLLQASERHRLVKATDLLGIPLKAEQVRKICMFILEANLDAFAPKAHPKLPFETSKAVLELCHLSQSIGALNLATFEQRPRLEHLLTTLGYNALGSVIESTLQHLHSSQSGETP